MSLSYPIKDKNIIAAIKDLYRKKALLRDLLLFTLAINTGLKLVDLLTLHVGDVKSKDYLILYQNELKSIKTYPLNSESQNLIKEIVQDRAETELLFCTKRRKQLDRSYIHKNFQQICKELGIADKYSILSWRKTFGYHYFKNTGDISMLMWIFNAQAIEKTLDFIDTEANFNFRFEKGFAI